MDDASTEGSQKIIATLDVLLSDERPDESKPVDPSQAVKVEAEVSADKIHPVVVVEENPQEAPPIPQDLVAIGHQMQKAMANWLLAGKTLERELDLFMASVIHEQERLRIMMAHPPQQQQPPPYYPPQQQQPPPYYPPQQQQQHYPQQPPQQQQPPPYYPPQQQQQHYPQQPLQHLYASPPPRPQYTADGPVLLDPLGYPIGDY